MRTRSAENTPSSPGGVIAVIGGIIQDMVFETERMPSNDESLDATSLKYLPGGKGSNTSVAIYRAQHKRPISYDSAGKINGTAEENDDGEDVQTVVQVYINTAVGNDNFGRQLKRKLGKNGVNVSGVRQLKTEDTGTCAVFVDSYSGQSRDIGYPGANTHWTPRNNSVECLADGYTPDLIVAHLETKRETVEGILQTAHNNNVDTLLNPSPVTYLLSSVYKHVTHLVVNEREAAELSGVAAPGELVSLEKWREAARRFLKWGVQNVVITVGEKGAFYATKGKEGLVPAVGDVQVKDTTGAG